MELSTSRPRVLGWLRSAAILDGDWGTSIAYVLGISYFLAGNASGLHLVMMLGLTTMVALNYVTICRLYPSGGGVYSSVSHRSRTLAVVGALLLSADYVVTASLSVLEACHYFDVAQPELWAIVFIIAIGAVNWFGPRHGGTVAITISLATIISLGVLVAAAFPSAMSHVHLEASPGGLEANWRIFVGIILSISGIEAISNMTGVMKDPQRNSRRAILMVLGKIGVATLVLGFAMLAIPELDRSEHKEYMIRFLGEWYVGDWFGPIIGVVIGLLLISAGNTAINALTSIQFLMAVDGELPKSLRKLNKFGVPAYPLIIATLIPIVVLLLVHDVITLAQMYAIGVVGAIAINIGSTGTDREIKVSFFSRGFMIFSTVILVLIEVTIAVEKTKALIFAVCVLALGMFARWIATRKRAVAPLPIRVSEVVTASAPTPGPVVGPVASRMMVAVRGGGEKLLTHACEEAKLRSAFLFVLHIKQVSVFGILPDSLPTDSFPSQDWVDQICREYGVPYRNLTIISNEAGYTIAEQAATFGVDRLVLGATQRKLMEKALRGDVIRTVSQLLPEEIQLVIYRA